MEPLIGKTIYLRLLELADFDAILRIENNPDFWDISGTQEAFSRDMIMAFILNAKKDISEVGQLRLAIVTRETHKMVGLIDLFNYDGYHKRAGVGVLIERVENRRKGYSAQALRLLLQYAKKSLSLKQLYANILVDNAASVGLFEGQGFQKIGVKKQWRRVKEDFKDESLYQHIL